MTEEYNFTVTETTGLTTDHEGDEGEARDPSQCRLLTTGMLAEVCSVAPRTVSKWFDSGVLTGFRLPASADRRVSRATALRFVKVHGMDHAVRALSIPIAIPEAAREAIRSDVLTTGQVAVILEVAPRTVSKWFDLGFFRGGYRIPGSQDRRIPRESFLTFCREHAIPVEEMLMGIGGTNLLCYGRGTLLAYIVSAMKKYREVEQVVERSAVLGLLETRIPAGLIVEVAPGEDEFLNETLSNVRRMSPDTIITLIDTGAGFASVRRELSDERFAANMHIDLAIERLKTLLCIGMIRNETGRGFLYE